MRHISAFHFHPFFLLPFLPRQKTLWISLSPIVVSSENVRQLVSRLKNRSSLQTSLRWAGSDGVASSRNKWGAKIKLVKSAKTSMTSFIERIVTQNRFSNNLKTFLFHFFNKLFFKWAILSHFFFIFVFSTVNSKYVFNKICRWLDWNRGPLVSQVTFLPTEPQPLSIF